MEHLKRLEIELDGLSGCPRCNIEKPLGELRKWAELNPHKNCPLAGTGNDDLAYRQSVIESDNQNRILGPCLNSLMIPDAKANNEMPLINQPSQQQQGGSLQTVSVNKKPAPCPFHGNIPPKHYIAPNNNHTHSNMIPARVLAQRSSSLVGGSSQGGNSGASEQYAASPQRGHLSSLHNGSDNGSTRMGSIQEYKMHIVQGSYNSPSPMNLHAVGGQHRHLSPGSGAVPRVPSPMQTAQRQQGGGGPSSDNSMYDSRRLPLQMQQQQSPQTDSFRKFRNNDLPCMQQQHYDVNKF